MTVTNEHRNTLARDRYAAKKEEIARKRREERNANLDEARARQRASYYRNREAKLAYQKEYREKNIERIREQRAQTYQRHRDTRLEKNRKHKLKRSYGLTIEEWNAMFEKQGKACAICGSTDPGATNHKFHTDHCHKTKAVRGILCQPCNTGLGKFKDSPELMRKAIQYLGAE